MTNEQAKSELMQIYGSLSEEKKKALDVAFKAMEQADNIPVMYYPQVDGITPTVVAQADGEKNCFNCKWYPDNDITKGFDEVCHKCSNSDKWEGLIKRAPWEDIAPPPKIPEAQADGEYISKQVVLNTIDKWYEDKADIEDLIVKITYMLSVAIPPDHDGCKDCKYQANPQDAMPCRECKQNYMDKWKAIPSAEPKTGHWILQPSNKEQGERDFIWWKCSECGQVIYSETEKDRREYHAFCGRCGKRMIEPQEREVRNG